VSTVSPRGKGVVVATSCVTCGLILDFFFGDGGDFYPEGVGQGPPAALFASIFLLSREFSSLRASISSVLLFFYSTNSCCIAAWASKKHDISNEGPASPTSTVGTLVWTFVVVLLLDTNLA